MADEQAIMATEEEDRGEARVLEPPAASSGSASSSMEDTPPAIVSHELGLRDERIRSLVGLELPVYASSMAKVLETVGGLRNLQQTHEAKSQFLPVKLRPTEPSCKPLFADLTKTQMILLRVTRSKSTKKAKKHTNSKTTGDRRRSRPADADAQDNRETQPTAIAADGSKLRAEIVGLVREKYVCEGMADFQYFTARPFYPADGAVAGSGGSEEPPSVRHEELVIPDNGNGPVCKPSARQLELQASLRPYLAVESESQLELIPEVFSKVDLPLKYEFRQRSGYQPTASAKKPSSTMTYLNFHDATAAPAGPKPDQPVVRRRPVGAQDDGVDSHVLEVLQTKLAHKPVWLRAKLFDGLDALERRAARRLLRKLCYVFVDGPWRGSWIRMGYDPRLPEVLEEASRYQVVELRNNRELVHAKVTHPSRKRTKKFTGASSGGTTGNGDSTHVKGPRIVKVTQTSALENAQASKRRRKERFSRGETRRSYLVEPAPNSSPTNSAGVLLSPRLSPEASTLTPGGDWDSDQDQEDKEDKEQSVTATANGEDVEVAGNSATAATTPPNGGEGTFEIFGVPLTSANVLFQLDEVDDDEIRSWTAQFAKLASPSLLGGWYPTQMFLPLREMIRLRIAALVGRSNAELETRRKRLDALQKQALSDYADEMAGGGHKTNGQQKTKEDSGFSESVAGPRGTAAAATDAEEDELAFERSLLREQRSGSHVAKLSTRDEADHEEEDDEEDLDLQEEEDETGRSRAAFEEDMDDDDDQEEEEEEEDEDEQAGEAGQEKQRGGAGKTKRTTYSGTRSTSANADQQKSAAVTEYSF
ncbi:hypothetical protein BBJ28_00013358 [Nothophytophthora sp. Chile5]|nr:hypothetical protein BBJ28_00013358 [Nothophytophthora sp. Chile5]